MAEQNSPYVNSNTNMENGDIDNNVIYNGNGWEMPEMEMEYEEVLSMLAQLDNSSKHAEDSFQEQYMTSLLVADENSEYKGYWERIRNLYHNTKNTVVKEAIIDYCKRMNQTPFNVTFREQLATVIETTSWNKFTEKDEILASYVIDNFIQTIKNMTPSMNLQGNMMSEMEYTGWKTELEKYYRTNSMDFVRSMKQNLDTETHIMQIAIQAPKMEPMSPLSSSENNHVYQNGNGNEVSGNQYQIQKRLQIFDKMKGEIIDKFSTELSPMNQNLMEKTCGNLSFWDRGHPVEYPTWNATLKKNYDDIKNEREKTIALKQDIAQHLASYADESYMLLNQILFQIKQWQRMKAYEYNGKSCSDACNIETLSIWCNCFTRILAECYSLSRTLGSMSILDVPQLRDERLASIMQTMAKYEEMIKSIISKSLVIEKHPPQVLMKDKKFQCQLRLLIGDALDVYQKLFHCEVSLISDEVHERIRNENVHTKLELSGKIINPKTKAEFQEQSKHVQVCMRSMTLQLKQRGDRRGTSTAEVVAEEKFCMVFRATITTGFFSHNVATEIYAQVFSLPIVVISHGKQEPDAQATIFWDNAFSEMDRSKFDVRKSVPWSQMQVELNCRWQKDCGLGLSREALEFLTMKLFSCPNIGQNELITWDSFNKKPIYCPPDKVTFWTWFYRIMELVRHKHLKKYWNDELIHGFLTKQSCMKKLLDDKIKVGTFLFRFSESRLGAISIACKEINDKGEIVVKHYEPDTLKDLDVLSLAKTVLDLTRLQYFYTGSPKKEVFEKYLPRPTSNPNAGDYIRKELKVSTARS